MRRSLTDFPQPRSMSPPIFGNPALERASSGTRAADVFLPSGSIPQLAKAANAAARLNTETRFTAVTREGISEWNAWGECAAGGRSARH